MRRIGIDVGGTNTDAVLVDDAGVEGWVLDLRRITGLAPLEKRLRQASKEGLIESDYLGLQIGEAEKAQVISKAEANSLRDYYEKVAALLDVDDFAPDEYLSGSKASAPAAPRRKAAKKPARKKAASKKKAAAKPRKKASKKKATKI